MTPRFDDSPKSATGRVNSPPSGSRKRPSKADCFAPFKSDRLLGGNVIGPLSAAWLRAFPAHFLSRRRPSCCANKERGIPPAHLIARHGPDLQVALQNPPFVGVSHTQNEGGPRRGGSAASPRRSRAAAPAKGSGRRGDARDPSFLTTCCIARTTFLPRVFRCRFGQVCWQLTAEMSRRRQCLRVSVSVSGERKVE